jgi:hypothetical protein
MLNDAEFRLLLLHQKGHDMVKLYQKANFTPDQDAFIKALVRYVNELARMIAKEEGDIVANL